MQTSKHVDNEDQLARIPPKLSLEVRYLSFNVNGSRTLFNYHPWNQLKGDFNAFLLALDGDLISLQELKIQLDGVTKFGLLKDFRSFILVPKHKKGYSGVGLYVRIPRLDDSPQVQQALTVVKAEEGITGRLNDKLKNIPYHKLPNSESIGGYLLQEDITDLGMTEQDVLRLDTEGRCAIVELANNTIVFSLYCPANSMGTPEGQTFRLNFLEMLFRRCANLQKLEKKIVVMGDINVSPDLIDSAESINELIKKNAVTNNLSEGGDKFEEINEEVCLAFQSSSLHRSLLHRYIYPTLKGAPNYCTQFLFDTTRIFKNRELALYTVWNTMTNARQSNFGSRIDLILISSEDDLQNMRRSEILPFLHGSDHCPIITDICVAYQTPKLLKAAQKLSFEAKVFYKLVEHRDISTLFSIASSKRTPDSENPNSTGVQEDRSASQMTAKKQKLTSSAKIKYTGRKSAQLKVSQQPIHNFFFQSRHQNSSHNLLHQNCDDIKIESRNLRAGDVVSQFANLVYDDPPFCHHDEKCVLRTSMKNSSKGKKFWCCARDFKGSTIELGEHRCDFFEWAKKRA